MSQGSRQGKRRDDAPPLIHRPISMPASTELDFAADIPTESTSLLGSKPRHRYAHDEGEEVNVESFPRDFITPPVGSRYRKPLTWSLRNRSHSWNPAQLRAIAEPIRRYKRRSGAYDEDRHALVQEGGGIRVWYDDYTTIDWIHDYVKERVRLRKLLSIKGVRGWFLRSCDSLQGWFLVFLIGVVTACFAGIVDVAAELGSDVKGGYCSKDWRLNKAFCCNNEPEESCSHWKTWSQAFDVQDSENSAWWFDYAAYVTIAFCFAVLSAILVKYNSLPVSPSTKSSSTITPRASKRFKSYASGSGVPEVKTILSGFVIRGYLGLRTLWVKIIGLALVVSSGMTLGKEGPFVHIACCVGNILSRFFHKYNKNEGKRREVLSASAAAGVSVAFAAPIGGVLFSLEEVSYYFPAKTLIRSFFCAIVAAVTLKLINPFGTGKIVLFQVHYDKDWHAFEMISFLILGILGGISGALLSKLIIVYTKYIRNGTCLKNAPVTEVIIVVLITASVNFLNPYTRMSNTDLVADLFTECSPDNDLSGLCVSSPSQIMPLLQFLLITLVSKFLTCIITFGIRTPAGIFIPSLLIGACIGRMLGLFVQWLTLTYPDSPIFSVCDQSRMSDCIIPGVYALVGAAACLAGVTRMTVSLTVIMFELTGALTYVLPIMTAIMIAKWVADGILSHGIYDLLIDLNGHPFLDPKAEYIPTANTLDLCNRNLEVIDINSINTVGNLMAKIKRLAASGYADAGFPILDGNVLVGYIASNELEHALNRAHDRGDDAQCYFRQIDPHNSTKLYDKFSDFTAYMDMAPLTVSQNASIEVVLELFKKLGLRYLCVVNAGLYIGVIHKKWLLAHLKEMEGVHT